MLSPNYIWRKSVGRSWLDANETRLFALTTGAFALIERPGRKRSLVEVPCQNSAELVRAFGGTSEKLPPNWLDQFFRPKAAKPIRIGARLVISSIGESCDVLLIPAEAAFGTGEHATTAMSLRILERATRGLTSGWRMLDAGTGSGILALAGKRFGAAEVMAIDHDPIAIFTAKRNARANGISGVKFLIGDLTKPISGRYEIIAANLYSDLLIAILPRFHQSLTRDGRMILSGVLRQQEGQLSRALRSRGFQILEVRRRGKWIALLTSRAQKAVDAIKG